MIQFRTKEQTRIEESKDMLMSIVLFPPICEIFQKREKQK